MSDPLQTFLVASGLLIFHAPDGHEIFVNPHTITTLHQKLGAGKGTFTPEAACLINTSDGKFITVTENCLRVLDTIRGAK